MKPIITSQCAQPTVRNFTMRVWAMNSLIIVPRRGPIGQKRELSTFWPSLMVRNIRTTPPRNKYQQKRLITAAVVPMAIVVAVTGAYRPFV